MSKFVNIAHISILEPNLPQSIILGQDNSKYYINDLDVQFALGAKFHKNWNTFQFWGQISQIFIFVSGSPIPVNILIISMVHLFWVLNFIKIRHIAILRSNLPKYLISGQNPQFQIFKISYLWLMNAICSECQISKHWEYISFLGPIFSGMSGLVLVLKSNVRYLAVILLFLVVTWWLLVII